MDLSTLDGNGFATAVKSLEPTLVHDGSSVQQTASPPRSYVSIHSDELHNLTQIYDSISNESEIERTHGFNSYDLRPSARDGKTVFITTWFDIDESGDYDPNNKVKQTPKDRDGKRLVPRRHDADSKVEGGTDRPPRGFQLSKLAARQQGCSMVVTLKLISEAGKTLASAVRDNWPGEHHNILSDQYLQKQAIQHFSQDTSPSGRKLRKIFEKSSTDSQNNSTGVTIIDPAGIEKDLSGHPAARGCVACRKLKIECPLLLSSNSWPCHLCIEDNYECELITPPAMKATCEQCRRKKLECSYVYGKSNTVQPCTKCTASQSHCIAGPAASGIRERISYDKDHAKPKPPEPPHRRYVTCTECRTKRLSCSLRRKTDLSPCCNCIASKRLCTFETVKPKPKERVTIEKAEETKLKPIKKRARDVQVPVGAELLHTSLCHPVELMVQEADKCHWCQNGSYGILGLGWKEVIVKNSDNGLTFDEISGGHFEQGQQNSIMCLPCSMNRLYTIACEQHELRPLDELIEKVSSPQSMYCSTSDSPNLQQHQYARKKEEKQQERLDTSRYEKEMREIYHRLINNDLLSTDKFCSLCPSLALFKCCTTQETDIWGDPQSPSLPEAEGCKLMLCQDCASVLEDKEGDLDSVIKAILAEKKIDIEDNKAIWCWGPRADAEFLLKDGLLARMVFAGSGMGEDYGGSMEIDR